MLAVPLHASCAAVTLDATSHAVLAAPLSIWLARAAASVTRYCLAMIQGPDAGDPNCVFPDEYGDTNDGYSACLVRSQLRAALLKMTRA